MVDQNLMSCGTCYCVHKCKKSIHIAMKVISVFVCVQVQIEESILTVRQERLKMLAEQCEVDLAVFDETVQPIIDSCTKDAIMVSQLWVCACCSMCVERVCVSVCACAYAAVCECMYGFMCEGGEGLGGFCWVVQ